MKFFNFNNLVFYLALKNILGSRRRSALTLAVISFGIMFYLILSAMLEGMNVQSLENMIKYEMGHLQIRHREYDPDFQYDLKNALLKADPILALLHKNKFIRGAAARIQFMAELDNSIDSLPVIVNGIDVKNYDTVFSLGDSIEKGSLKKNGFLLGVNLARDLKVGLGDTVYLTVRGQKGMFHSRAFQLTGLINSMDPLVNSSMVFIDREKAAEISQSALVNNIAIRTDDFRKSLEYKAILQKELGRDYHVESWEDMAQDFIAMLKLKKTASSIMLLFIMIIGALGIANTLILSIYEKKQQIATLKALGLKNSKIKKIFITEGVLLGIGGALLGMLLGTLANLFFIYHGLDISIWMESEDMNQFGLRILGKMYSQWMFMPYVFAMFFTIIVATLASYFPVKNISKIEAATAMRPD